MDTVLTFAIIVLVAFVIVVAVIIVVLGYLLDKSFTGKGGKKNSKKDSKASLFIPRTVLAAILCIIADIVAYQRVIFVLEYKADYVTVFGEMAAVQPYIFAVFVLTAFAIADILILSLLCYLLDKSLQKKYSEKCLRTSLTILGAILASLLCIIAGIVAYQSVVPILEYKANDIAELGKMAAVQPYVFPVFVLTAYIILVALIVAWLGYFLDGGLGVILLTAATIIASLLCVFVGFRVGLMHSQRWGWIAALGVAALVGWVIPLIGGKAFFSPKGARLTRILWFWYAALGVMVFTKGEWFYLAAIVLPAFVLLIGGLFFSSRFLLPIGDHKQCTKAFRSLLSFALGTNFPFYVIRDWKKEKLEPRVEGNTYGKFFSGPGVVLTSCDHLVITTTGVKENIVKPPGLNFTDKYEKIQDVVDLRPQLRAFSVKTKTKNGIPVDVFSFWPVQIDTEGRKPEIGMSFPFSEDGVFRAVYKQSQGHKWERDETGTASDDLKKIDWDDFHAQVIAPPILKKVISEYTCDELCSPGDPRVDIKKEIRRRLEDELEPYGIQIVGGGISNLIPTTEVIQQRIENWKASWKQEIATEIGKLKATQAQYKPEVIRSQVEIEMIRKIAKSFDSILSNNNQSQQMIVLGFIESIQEMLKQSPNIEDISPEAWEMLAMQQRRFNR